MLVQEYITLDYKDIIQGHKMEDDRVRYHRGFWSNLDHVMGGYKTTYRQVTKIFNNVTKRIGNTEYSDENKNNNLINWIKDLNLPAYIFNLLVLDIEKYCKERVFVSMSYQLPFYKFDKISVHKHYYDGDKRIREAITVNLDHIEYSELFGLTFSYSYLESDEYPSMSIITSTLKDKDDLMTEVEETKSLFSIRR